MLRIRIQALFCLNPGKSWVLAQLHAYFVLHNNKEKNDFVVYYLLTSYMLIRSTRLFDTLEYRQVGILPHSDSFH